MASDREMRRQEAKKFAAEAVKGLPLDALAGLVCYESEEIASLGINRYNWWNEASHGVARNGVATVFPCPTALAATFDPELIRKIGDAVSTEARAKYNVYSSHGEYDIYKGLTFWCPNVNIYRDPRWGRGQETFGEDPCLTSTLAVEYVKGLQGDGEFWKAAACAKHFAVHSGPESLRHEFNAEVSERDLRETYLPAFEETVKAGVAGVMGAYNRTCGEPCCASDKLSEILFDEWGFDGYFMSDNYALDDIHGGHCYTSDPAETAATAIKHGISLDCAFVYRDHVKEAIERGLITKEELERAAAKTLEIRAMLGEFEKTRPYSDVDWDEVDSERMRELNLRAAAECLVLLKGGEGLPVNKEKYKRIAVVGPLADSRDALVGNYKGRPAEYITVLDGIKRVFKDSTVRFAEGSQIIEEDRNSIFGYGDMISEGAEEARRADLTILCLGLDATLEGEESRMQNEVIAGGDRRSVGLPDTQKRLLHEVLGKSDNVIVVTFCGGCIDIGDEAREKALAHIHAWYPGALGGYAVAKAVSGEAPINGRLPVTFYRESADLPDFCDYSMARRTRFSDRDSVLYPFAHGIFTEESAVRIESIEGGDGETDVCVSVVNRSDAAIRRKICVFTDKGEEIAEENFALCAVRAVDVAPRSEERVTLRIDERWYLPYGDDGCRRHAGNIRFRVE